jgi:hypothetical protein
LATDLIADGALLLGGAEGGGEIEAPDDPGQGCVAQRPVEHRD